jgi:hypothetical protein
MQPVSVHPTSLNIQKDLKSHIKFNTVVVGYFNTPLSLMDRSPRQKSNKEILELNDSIDATDLTYVYRIFHPATEQYSSQQPIELSTK